MTMTIEQAQAIVENRATASFEDLCKAAEFFANKKNAASAQVKSKGASASTLMLQAGYAFPDRQTPESETLQKAGAYVSVTHGRFLRKLKDSGLAFTVKTGRDSKATEKDLPEIGAAFDLNTGQARNIYAQMKPFMVEALDLDDCIKAFDKGARVEGMATLDEIKQAIVTLEAFAWLYGKPASIDNLTAAMGDKECQVMARTKLERNAEQAKIEALEDTRVNFKSALQAMISAGLQDDVAAILADVTEQRKPAKHEKAA